MKVGRRETVRRALKSLRASVGLSQLAVAAQLGMTERRYWLIENWYEQPTDAERKRLARVLKVTEDALPWPTLAERAS